MSEQLTIRSVDAVLVVVPMRRALGTSAMGIAEAPLLLIDLQTGEGITGRSYLFCYLEAAGHAAIPLIRDVSAVLAGTVASPAAVRRALAARFRLLGARGLVSAVLARVDVACWDALAIAAGLPLARMLGATMRPTAAYNSNGLGLLEPQAAADEAQELVAEGFRAIKMRIGRPSGDDDLAAVRAVRAAIPPDVALMSDYNQALGPSTARERCRQLDDEGLYWIEEPVRHDDYATSAELAARLRTPVQIGENFTGPRAMSLALQRRASDLVMPDLERIGGSQRMAGGRGAGRRGRYRTSAHLYPEVSAHLLAATPTAHWIEYVDWADPILEQPLQVTDGRVVPLDRPGTGLAWNAAAVSHYPAKLTRAAAPPLSGLDPRRRHHRSSQTVQGVDDLGPLGAGAVIAVNIDPPDRVAGVEDGDGGHRHDERAVGVDRGQVKTELKLGCAGFVGRRGQDAEPGVRPGYRGRRARRTRGRVSAASTATRRGPAG